MSYNNQIYYPEDPTKKGYTFKEWNPKPDKMPANDTTVVAQWMINSYKLTFDFNNGSSTAISIVEYNSTITYPENPTKEGYTFIGWYPKPERMPASNLTVTAQWETVKPTEYVEIMFGSKDISDEEVETILKNYTQEEFVIDRIERDALTGETKVIIKFVDSEKAKDFVRTVREGRRENNLIMRTKTVEMKDGSFAKRTAITITSTLLLAFTALVQFSI